jgi:hypothetical protein
VILERRRVTNALKEMLERAGGPDHPVGITFAPDDADLAKGYYVIHSIPGGGYPSEGYSLMNPDEDANVVYQIDGVSGRHDGAEWLGDRARHVLLARQPSGEFQVRLDLPAGWGCTDRRPDGETPGATPEGTRPHEVYTVSERFVLSLTPN